jgi:hypothetical protein
VFSAVVDQKISIPSRWWITRGGVIAQFVAARTIEYFRLGKVLFAIGKRMRAVSGDTRVTLVDGLAPP